MTDEAWIKGMAELQCLPVQDDSKERKAIRGTVYRRELDALSDALWLGVVRLAIQRCRWLPPVSTLLEFASEVYESPMLGAPRLSEDTRTVEQKRGDAKAGFEIFKRELRKQGMDVDELVDKFSWKGRDPGQEG